MSGIATNLLPKGFIKLSGPENYTAWKKDFKRIVIFDWGFYQGIEEILEKPNLETLLRTAQSESADQQITEPAAADATQNYEDLIAIHNMHLAEWRRSDESVRFALNLLRSAVEPHLWPHNINNPVVAWTAIQEANEPDADTRLEHALTQMERIRIQNYKNIREYIWQFDNILQRYQGSRRQLLLHPTHPQHHPRLTCPIHSVRYLLEYLLDQ